MTTTYSYSKAKESFDLLFKEAFDEGQVKIEKDNQVFVLMPEVSGVSPLAVEGIKSTLTTNDIISCIHEGRKAYD